MDSRAYWRLSDMKQAITEIRNLLSDKSIESLASEPATRAAYERFLEILSEASRHVPETWKAEHPDIAWRQVADLGNFIRHAYHKIDLQILWAVFEDELDGLEAVTDRLIDRASHQIGDTGNTD